MLGLRNKEQIRERDYKQCHGHCSQAGLGTHMHDRRGRFLLRLMSHSPVVTQKQESLGLGWQCHQVQGKEFR